MADVITRFKLETTQYDSKLRDTVKGLKEIVHMNELAGKDFKEFSASAIQAARALGQQATGATNAKDKVKELVSAYNDMAKTYNEMSETMKKSEGGKALASSLQELQQRIKDAKTEMSAAPGMLDNLASKFVVNIDAIKLFNVGLQAAEGALSIAKDAFFSNEQQLDDWGRTVESSKSLYTGFLDALNTSDISGYLQRIGQITAAARDAYNALDNLNTFNAFNQINVEKTRTGMTESIADYRSGQGSKESVRIAGAAYQKELRERQKLEREAYRKAVMEKAAERGVNGNDLLMALSGTYGSYQSLKAIPMSGRKLVNVGGGMFGGGTTYEAEFAANRQEKLGAALRRLNDTELQSLQALGAQAERTGNEIAQVDKQLSRVLNGRQIGGGITSGITGGSGGAGGRGGGAAAKLPSYDDFMKQELKAGLVDKSQLENSGPSELWKSIVEGANAAKDSVDGLTNAFQELNAAQGVSGKDTDDTNKKLKKMGSTTEYAAETVRSIGDAFSSIEDPAAKVAGTVMQSIATVALGYAQATLAAAQTGNPWVWAAFAASGLAQMLTMISTIHGATGFAEGGVVQGNTYSSDQIPAMLNAGEVVLNRAQVGTLAGSFSGEGGRVLNLRGVLRGSDILLSVERKLIEQGKGQLVTFK